jgi:hypothetical protein
MFRKHRSLSLYSLIFLSLAFFTAQTAAAQSNDVRKDLNGELKNYTIVSLDSSAARQQVDHTKKLTLRSGDRDFELELTPRDLRSARYTAEETGPGGNKEVPFGGINTFKGKITGDSASSVRLYMDGSKIEGYFFTATEKFYVEPAGHFSRSANPNELVVYKAEDMLHPFSLHCEHHVQDKIEAGKTFVAPEMVPEVLSLRVVEVATDADFEFVSSMGDSLSTNADVMNSLNMVEGVYENELGITFSVVFQHTWTTGDPYASTSPEGVVRAFMNYWNANYPVTNTQYARDTAHLWTAKSYAASQGWAFIDVVCNRPDSAYGLTGKLEWVPAKYMITAHEMGHNLGAVHVEAADGCADTLMNAQLSTTTPFTFCSVSRTQIGNHVSDPVKGACLASRSSVATRFDYDGDGKADLGIFRPSNGSWFILNSGNSSFSIFQFGQAGDKPVSEDFDGDGKADAALYRNGGWFKLKSSNGTVEGIGFGVSSDIPAPADYDGDGKADIAVYRPSDGRWYIFPTGSANFNVVQFGTSEDIPVPGDFDGDGKADVNVFRPSNGIWYRLNSRDGGFVANQFGSADDKPQAGDFDGDGKADLAIYRPSNGAWYVANSGNNTVKGIIFGVSTDIPVPADFDGDGKADIAVYRPSEGNWYRLNSADGRFVVYQFGNSTDIPALSR